MTEQNPYITSDPAEEAYWRFDARRNGYSYWKEAPMSERDSFKAEFRLGMRHADLKRQEALNTTFRLRWIPEGLNYYADTPFGRISIQHQFLDTYEVTQFPGGLTREGSLSYLMEESERALISKAETLLGGSELVKYAKLYEALRKMTWFNSPLCVVENPKVAVKIGSSCPSLGILDDILLDTITEPGSPDTAEG